MVFDKGRLGQLRYLIAIIRIPLDLIEEASGKRNVFVEKRKLILKLMIN